MPSIRWIGSDLYEAADAQLFVTASFTPLAQVSASDRVVATATDSFDIGGTSEFSSRIEVLPEPGLVVTLLAGAAQIGILQRRRRNHNGQITTSAPSS